MLAPLSSGSGGSAPGGAPGGGADRDGEAGHGGQQQRHGGHGARPGDGGGERQRRAQRLRDERGRQQGEQEARHEPGERRPPGPPHQIGADVGEDGHAGDLPAPRPRLTPGRPAVTEPQHGDGTAEAANRDDQPGQQREAGARLRGRRREQVHDGSGHGRRGGGGRRRRGRGRGRRGRRGGRRGGGRGRGGGRPRCRWRRGRAGGGRTRRGRRR